jgi:hypothetical protein
MSFLDEMDFNLEEDVKPEPLIPDGKYCGGVISVEEATKINALRFKICLSGNGDDLFMTDGETPIDGAHLEYMVWLPKPGDEDIPATNGKGTKKDTKLRMLDNFFRQMGINAKTPAAIREAIQNGEWVGMDVIATVETKMDNYVGKVISRIRWLEADIKDPL